jgi:hypothetical protein
VPAQRRGDRGSSAAPVRGISDNKKEALVAPGAAPLLKGSLGPTRGEEGSKGGPIHGDPHQGKIEHAGGRLPEVEKRRRCGHKVEADFVL